MKLYQNDLYPRSLKNWRLNCAKATGLRLSKEGFVFLLLRQLNRGSFCCGLIANFSVILGVKIFSVRFNRTPQFWGLRIFLFCLGVVSVLQGDQGEEIMPLYAGTQLAFYPNNVDPGHLSLQPFLFYIHRYGQYVSNWSERSQKNINGVVGLFSLEAGVTSWLDVSCYLNGAYRRFGDKNSWIVGDMSLFFGIQAARDRKGQWVPDLRLLLGATFPTGKYDHLNVRKNRSDAFGTGAYITTAVLVVAKTFYAFPRHPCKANLNIIYNHSSKAKAQGYSIYSNGVRCYGTASSSSGVTVNLGLECSLDRFWVIGMDMRYVYQDKIGFKPKERRFKQTGLPSSEQFSLAPCLEYSWNEYFSATVGPWFTVAGRNTDAFFGMIGNVFFCF